MNTRNFTLSYYKNAADGMHIQLVEKPVAATEPHMHEHFQIYYMLKGKITHHVGDSSNRLAQNFLSRVAVLAESEIHPKITLPVGDIFFIEAVFAKMLDEFSKQEVGVGELMCSGTVMLLTEFARIYYTAEPQYLTVDGENKRQIILHLVRYLDENFTEKLTLDEAAKHSAMSKSSFCSAFRSVTGKTFSAYINEKRIEYAAELLKKGYSASGIYGLCGYGDPSTLYRNFKKIMGTSPSGTTTGGKQTPMTKKETDTTRR